MEGKKIDECVKLNVHELALLKDAVFEYRSPGDQMDACIQLFKKIEIALDSIACHEH